MGDDEEPVLSGKEETESLGTNWFSWWRQHVTTELDRLNDNDKALLKAITRVEKNACVDIKELQVLAQQAGRKEGIFWGIVSAGIIGMFTYMLENPGVLFRVVTLVATHG